LGDISEFPPGEVYGDLSEFGDISEFPQGLMAVEKKERSEYGMKQSQRMLSIDHRA
jgi:hypothetical protein